MFLEDTCLGHEEGANWHRSLTVVSAFPIIAVLTKDFCSKYLIRCFDYSTPGMATDASWFVHTCNDESIHARQGGLERRRSFHSHPGPQTAFSPRTPMQTPTSNIISIQQQPPRLVAKASSQP